MVVVRTTVFTVVRTVVTTFRRTLTSFKHDIAGSPPERSSRKAHAAPCPRPSGGVSRQQFAPARARPLPSPRGSDDRRTALACLARTDRRSGPAGRRGGAARGGGRKAAQPGLRD